MPAIAPDPELPFGLAPMQSAVPPGAVPFNRKTWDNPIRYKLNRAYGDEFDSYGTFAQLTRRWTARGATPPVAADFDFTAGSSIGWRMTNNSSILTIPAPAGDFEALLEFSYAGYIGGSGDANAVFAPAITVTDTVGTGGGCAIYVNDLKAYDTALTTWNTGASHTVTPVTVSVDGRHHWLAARRTGTNLQCRVSVDGSTFSALTSGTTVSASAAVIGIGKCYPSSVQRVGFITLYRFNVYSGSTFFPG